MGYTCPVNTGARRYMHAGQVELAGRWAQDKNILCAGY